ncbi:unnamed protein product, partial [Candidula unifasciata]
IDKMEKAEILEKTLEVLTRLRHENPKISHTASTHKAMAIRYASGFSLCAEESIRYIQNSRLVPSEVKVHLQNHLRAIARRVESTMQIDRQTDLNPAQCFSASSSTISSPSLGKVTAREIISSSADNLLGLGPVSGQFSGEVSEGSDCYIHSPVLYSTQGSNCLLTSPVCYSTPISYSHLPFIKSDAQLQKDGHKLLNYSSEAYTCSIVDQRKKSARGRAAQTPGQPTQIKPVKQTLSLSSDSQFDKSEGYCSDFSQSKHYYLSPYSSLSSSCLISSYYSDASFTDSPPLMANSSVLPNTPILPDRTVYPHHRFEPHITTPNILGESTQVNSSLLLTPAIKEFPRSNNVLDLCVKRTDEQQISQEAMWRPW